MSGRKWCAVRRYTVSFRCGFFLRAFHSILGLLLAASLFCYVAREQISVRCVVVVTVAAIRRRTDPSTHSHTLFGTSITEINFRQWNMHNFTGDVRERCVYLALEVSSSVSGAIWMRIWKWYSGHCSCSSDIMRFTRMMRTKWECRECGDRIEYGIFGENWEFVWRKIVQKFHSIFRLELCHGWKQFRYQLRKPSNGIPNFAVALNIHGAQKINF